MLEDRTTTPHTTQGLVAQMVEQRPRKSQVAGSIPRRGLQLSPWLYLPIDDYDRDLLLQNLNGKDAVTWDGQGTK